MNQEALVQLVGEINQLLNCDQRYVNDVVLKIKVRKLLHALGAPDR